MVRPANVEPFSESADWARAAGVARGTTTSTRNANNAQYYTQ